MMMRMMVVKVCVDVTLWCCVVMLCCDVVLWCCDVVLWCCVVMLCCDVVLCCVVLCCVVLCCVVMLWCFVVMVWVVVNVVVRWNDWFYAVWGFWWRTDKRTDIGDSRVAFATENVGSFREQKIILDHPSIEVIISKPYHIVKRRLYFPN